MTILFGDLFFALITTIILTFILIKYSFKLGLVDAPNERSFHKKLTPRGGGIVFTFVALFFIAIGNWDVVVQNYLIFVSILIVTITGVVDDLSDCRPRVKFAALFFAILLLYFNGTSISTLGYYLGYEITLPELLVFPFTFIAIAGFTNALNLIDGIDGLAGGVSLIILGTFLAIGIRFEDQFLILLSSTFMATVIGFLFLNWHPAKIFMGDSGSLTLGFVISVLAIESLQYINPTSVLFIAAIPLLDTSMVMLRRKQRHMSIFKADKNHMHHILYNQKRDVTFTTTMIWMLQLLFSIIGFRSIGQDDSWNVLLFVILFYVFFSFFDPRLRKRKKKQEKSLKKIDTCKREEDECIKTV